MSFRAAACFATVQDTSLLYRDCDNKWPACAVGIDRRARPRDGQPLMILVSSVRGKDVARFADLKMPNAAALVFIDDPANSAGVPME